MNKKFWVILLALVLVLTGCSKPQSNQEEVADNSEEEEVSRANYWSYYSNQNSYSTTWGLADNRGKLNTNVVSGARDKRTELKGNGNDTITIMVYMCGTDLESRSSMASYDLQEMAQATISDKINLLVYTGGCKTWKISGISSSVNQIYRVVGSGKIERLVDNAGNATMVDPNTLVSFIEWAAQNYEADRYELIFWDHGSGTTSGYGYDEKYPNAGSMDLAEIDQALTAADVEFDFIGFDACLMATTETALMLTEHADYMIASEESEPGIGWYYTNWLTKLSANTSMSTVEIGKNIIDDFVTTSAKQVPSQSATLSIIDLAELEYTIPSKISAFAQSASNLIANSGYSTISKARSGSREFASDSKIDMVDLVDLTSRIDTTESKELQEALLSCIKYNRTSNDMSNSYGLSIYFPYRNAKYVNPTLSIYEQIDMNSDYTSCIRSFVSYQTSGQVSSGGTQTAYSSLSSNSYSNSSYTTQDAAEDILNVLGLFLGAGSSQTSNSAYSELYNLGMNLLFGRSNISMPSIAKFIEENHFDVDLNWVDDKIALTEEQWSLVDNLVLNMFVDDGEGYIDLGTDNVYEIDEDGNLIADGYQTWLAISNDGGENYSVIPYYFVSATGDEEHYKIYGRTPVLYNGEKASLLLLFTDEDPNGSVIGVTFDCEEDGMIAKTFDDSVLDTEFNITIEGEDTTVDISELKANDTIDFVCDYYTYDGEFSDSYLLGEQMVIKNGLSDLIIADVDISDYDLYATYEFTDIYQQHYWTAPLH